MTVTRLLAGAALSALLTTAALAQTGGTSGTYPSQAGGMAPPAAGAQPYAAPPTTGGMAQPSTSGNSMGGDTGGTMAPGSMQGGSMQGGSMSSGAMASGGAFTPIAPMAGANIIAELKASGEFTKLLAGLQATNLTTLISTHPNLTLFAPTDAAFAALPPGQLDMLLKTPAQLQAILTYHLVATSIKPGDVQGHAAGKVATAANKKITIDGSGSTLKVDDASVLQAGVPASNGSYIYVIDKVLTPPSA